MRSSLRRRLLVLVVATIATTAATLAQQVTKVIDGDTIVVAGVGTVRLIGVDTPETVDPRESVQHFGGEASAFTKKLAEGKAVRLEFEGARKDGYGRTLAYVYLPDGRLLNGEIIRQGFGHAYTDYPFSKMDAFRRFEREAMENARGLWAEGVAGVTPVAASTEAEQGNPNETVYATRTGTKYHRAGCRSLARSQIPMPLREAAARYGPCSTCRPPILSSAVAPAAPSRPAVSSGRCQAITKKGTQCSRAAQPGRSYCWQH